LHNLEELDESQIEQDFANQGKIAALCTKVSYADYSAIQMDLWNGGSVWLADIQQPRLYALSTAHK